LKSQQNDGLHIFVQLEVALFFVLVLALYNRGLNRDVSLFSRKAIIVSFKKPETLLPEFSPFKKYLNVLSSFI